jgi:RNA polymerase sigma-70 factor (ECF subfamily)
MNATSALRTNIDGGMISLLRGVVRRVVPPHEVDDVVQAALCDALRAARAPEERTELSRWLITIAKRRAADLHRARWRMVPLEDDAGDARGLSVEWRDAVRRVVDEAERDEGTQRALELSLREAEGESYAELAQAEHTTEVAMRQRLSRFRRGMAARWLAVAALGLALGWGGRAILRAHDDNVAIAPDIAGDVMAALRPFAGRWEIESWWGAEPLPGVRSIALEGGLVRVVTLAGTRDLTVRTVTPVAEGAQRWTLHSGSHDVTVLVEAKGERTVVTLEDGRWKGTAVLVRR